MDSLVFSSPLPSAPSHILDLNDDCLREIFGVLHLSDLCSVADVCTRFRHVAQETFVVPKYRKLKLHNLCRGNGTANDNIASQSERLQCIARFLCVFGAYVKSVDVNGSHHYGLHQINDNRILALINRFCTRRWSNCVWTILWPNRMDRMDDIDRCIVDESVPTILCITFHKWNDWKHFGWVRCGAYVQQISRPYVNIWNNWSNYIWLTMHYDWRPEIYSIWWRMPKIWKHFGTAKIFCFYSNDLPSMWTHSNDWCILWRHDANGNRWPLISHEVDAKWKLPKSWRQNIRIWLRSHWTVPMLTTYGKPNEWKRWTCFRANFCLCLLFDKIVGKKKWEFHLFVIRAPPLINLLINYYW